MRAETEWIPASQSQTISTPPVSVGGKLKIFCLNIPNRESRNRFVMAALYKFFLFSLIAPPDGDN